MNSKPKTNPNSEIWSEAIEIFHNLRELPESERDDYLNTATEGKPEVRSEVELFLSEIDDLENFMEEPLAPKLAVAMTKPYDAFSPGDQLGEFELKARVGHGAFATVYRAKQPSLDREVALKVSLNRGQEARTIAQLEHDHIVKVFSEFVLQEEDIRAICMQFIPSMNLQDILDKLRADTRRPLKGDSFLRIVDRHQDEAPRLNPVALKDREKLEEMTYPQAVLWMGSRLASALSYAHSKNVLHLDMKPGNILINHYGRPLLTDFNVSLNSESLERGSTENFGGTRDYMPPEQAEVFTSQDKPAAIKKLDGRADIYSLGLVIREMLELDPNWKSKEPSISQLNTQQVLLRATDPDPENRFEDAQDLAEALEACFELSEVETALPKGGGFTRFSQKHPLVSLTVFGAIPQLIASFVGITYNSLRIVENLNRDQQQVFQWLNFVYNPVIYTIATAVWIWALMRMLPYLKHPEQFRDQDRIVKKMRKHVLSVPLWGVAVTSFGWLPGAVTFPLAIHLKAGPLPFNVVCHFLLSFTLSYIISLAYSYLFHQWVVLRAIYPQCWIGQTNVRKNAQKELKGLSNQLRKFAFLTGLIPLLAASLILFAGPSQFAEDTYTTFRVLLLALIGMGVTGVAFALSVSQQLSQTIFAMMGPGSQSKNK